MITEEHGTAQQHDMVFVPVFKGIKYRNKCQFYLIIFYGYRVILLLEV